MRGCLLGIMFHGDIQMFKLVVSELFDHVTEERYAGVILRQLLQRLQLAIQAVNGTHRAKRSRWAYSS